MLSLTKTEAQALKPKLEEIKRHLDAVQSIFGTFNANQDHWCLEQHGESTSLNHIARWGNQAAHELVELLDAEVK